MTTRGVDATHTLTREPCPRADPFADAASTDKTGAVGLAQGIVHIRIQQRNGRKSITTVTGLSQQLDLKKILKAIKKEHCCNGTVLKDEDSKEEVLQFQGDQREAVKTFLIKEDITDKESIKVTLPQPSSHTPNPASCLGMLPQPAWHYLTSTAPRSSTVSKRLGIEGGIWNPTCVQGLEKWQRTICLKPQSAPRTTTRAMSQRPRALCRTGRRSLRSWGGSGFWGGGLTAWGRSKGEGGNCR